MRHLAIAAAPASDESESALKIIRKLKRKKASPIVIEAGLEARAFEEAASELSPPFRAGLDFLMQCYPAELKIRVLPSAMPDLTSTIFEAAKPLAKICEPEICAEFVRSSLAELDKLTTGLQYVEDLLREVIKLRPYSVLLRSFTHQYNTRGRLSNKQIQLAIQMYWTARTGGAEEALNNLSLDLWLLSKNLQSCAMYLGPDDELYKLLTGDDEIQSADD
jgi:hypothetical protein